ncbi:MAG TPA: lytic transglycosylase domain-containing protein [Thermoanaerobaculia bacterium]|nr:lytic transglycosylase domain-containing protein [Thermoanaerobaculia bacterium]
MPELNTKRPYQERFLDNFDRAQLRREVEAVPRSQRFGGLRKKYATWALGASLAIGGIGAPLKMMQNDHSGTAKGKHTSAASAALDTELAGDLKAARSIARQVAGGVEAVAGGVGAAVSHPLASVAEAPKKLSVVTEQVREDFFKKEVPFGSIIYNEAKKNNVRPELVAAVVQAESRFKPTARSGAGAIGLMQLVPRTGRWMGARDLTNPTQNIAAGTKYLKYLSERFDGNETKIIAAYNAGEGNVKRFGGVPPFKETRKYISKVRDYEKDYHNRVESRVADASSSLSGGVAGAVEQIATIEAR